MRFHYLITHRHNELRFGADGTTPIRSYAEARTLARDLVCRGGGEAVIYRALGMVHQAQVTYTEFDTTEEPS